MKNILKIASLKLITSLCLFNIAVHSNVPDYQKQVSIHSSQVTVNCDSVSLCDDSDDYNWPDSFIDVSFDNNIYRPFATLNASVLQQTHHVKQLKSSLLTLDIPPPAFF